MSKPNYVSGALSGLLRIIKQATPENQPSDAVLVAYTRLLELESQPARKDEELAELRGEVQKISARMGNMPKLETVMNRTRRQQWERDGTRRTG